MTRALRSLGAALVLVLTVAGLPTLLALTIGNPTAAWPDLLAGDLSDRALLDVVALVAYVAWAQFALAVLVEVAGALTHLARGRSHAALPAAPRVPVVFGGQQRLARSLVAALFLIGPAMTPTMANAAAPAALTARTTTVAVVQPLTRSVPAAATVSTPTTARSSTAAPAAPTTQGHHAAPALLHYTISQGGPSTFWDLAESHLGDGARWHELWALNRGRHQSDGAVMRSPNLLRNGWTVLLPPAGHLGGATLRTVTVRAGDTLTRIAAEHHLKSWHELWALNAGHQQPDGGRLDDPDHIEAGWTVLVPARVDAAPTPSHGPSSTVPTQPRNPEQPRPPASQPAPPAPPRHTTSPPTRTTSPSSSPTNVAPLSSPATPPITTSTTATTSAPAADTGGTPEPTPPAISAAPTASSTTSSSTPAPATASSAQDDELVTVRTAGGAGALLAACVVGLLAARRANQRRRRRPGERLPVPVGTTAVMEAELRATADPIGTELVDRALRRLVAAYRNMQLPLPELRAARLTRHVLELYLAQAAALPEPWLPIGEPTEPSQPGQQGDAGASTVWAVTHQRLAAHIEVEPGPQQDTRAPYPTLVTVGQDLDNGHLLLNLEHLPVLNIDGAHEEVLAVLRALAIELGTSPWIDDLLITVVGVMPELPEVLGTGRLRHVDRLDQVITDLEGRIADVERVLTDAGVTDLLEARGRGVAEDAWVPQVVLLADPVPAHLSERLDRVLQHAPSVGIATITGSGASLGPWRLRFVDDTVTAGEHLPVTRLEPIGLVLHPQMLIDEEYEEALRLLAGADDPPVPGPPWAARLPVDEPALQQLTPATTITDDPTALEDRPPQLSVTAKHEPRDAVQDDNEDSAPSGSPEQLRERVVKAPTPATQGPTSFNNVERPDHEPPTVHADDSQREEVLPDLVTLARAPSVRLFGKVTVLNASGPEPVTYKNGRAAHSSRGRAAALVAYLATRPDGATTPQILQALSPVLPMQPDSLTSLVSLTRKWLGNDPDGNPYFPMRSPRQSASGGTRLHPDVRTDWQHWLDLIGDDITATPTPRLLRALELVHGRPFDGVNEAHYSWAEHLRQEMTASVVDVAHEAARRALLDSDSVAARRAAATGRSVDPVSEILWRDALRAEYVAGNYTEMRRLIQQLYNLADELEMDLQPETDELLRQLDRTPTARAQ